MVAYVITWRYRDGSAAGAVGVFWSKESANQMLEVLGKHGDSNRAFSVDAVPCEPLP